MAVELQSYEVANFPAGNNNDQTSWTITKPSGLSVGDLLIVLGGIGDRAQRTVTAPSGWERIYKMPLDGYQASQGCTNAWWKIADSSDVAASNFTFTIGSGSNTMALIAFRYTGHDPLAPFDQLSISPDVYYSSGWGGNITAPSLTSRLDGCSAIRSFWIWNQDIDLYDVGGQNTTTLLNSKNTDGYDTTFAVLIDGTSTSSLTEYDDGDSVATKAMQSGSSSSYYYYSATLLIMPDQGMSALEQTVDAANAVTIQNGYENNGGTFTVNKPSGVSEDDLLIMVIVAEDSSRTITSTGFTVLLNEDFASEGLHILYKIAGASEGANYTVTNSGGSTSGFIGTLFAVSNVNTEDPIPSTAITESTMSSFKGNCPALTVGANGHLIVHVEAYDDNAAENSLKPARDYYVLPYLEENDGDDSAIAVSYSKFPSSASAAYPAETIWCLYDNAQYIGYTFAIAPLPSTGGASFLLFVDS